MSIVALLGRTLCRVLVTDVLGQPLRPIFKGQAVQVFLNDVTLKMRPICYPETSTLRNVPEERRYHLDRGGSL